MSLLSLLNLLNGGLVLIFGLLLSVHISGGWQDKKQKRLVVLLCPLFLIVQGVCALCFGVAVTEKLYPLIVHIPFVLILIFGMKVRVRMAIFSVCVAYLCCQLPRWGNQFVTALTQQPLAGEIAYTLIIGPAYALLQRYFTRFAHSAMSYSTQLMYLFGSLPLVYYFYDYTTVICSNTPHAGIPALAEFFPTAVAVFYLAFLSAYHAQTQKRTQAELQRSVLEVELKQAGSELESMRRVESQTALYRHNMRHHLNAIDAFLSVGDAAQAQEYIRSVQADVEAITPKRYCENELVNLLCSSFTAKAEHQAVRLTVNAQVPNQLPLSDTSLSSLLSNGLENALHAVSALDEDERQIRFSCNTRAGKLLIEIKNPYRGEITMQNGLPVSPREGHGYGCRSILSIAQQHGGLCTFEAEQGLFTLRVVLPLQT